MGDPPEAVEECGILPNRGRHRDRVALQKALIAISVSDDVNLGCDLRIALDQLADRRGEARCDTARRSTATLLTMSVR